MHTISPTIGYAFEPVTIDYLKSDDSKDHEEIENDVVVTCDVKNNKKMKQVSMNNFIKTIK